MNFPLTDRLCIVTAALLAALLSSSSAAAGRADATDRLPVSDLRQLLKLAIEQGSAHGVMTGVAADYARRKFETDAPIEVDIRKIETLPQPGCSRLEVTTRQKDVLENGANGTRGDKTLRYRLSYCRDGHLLERP